MTYAGRRPSRGQFPTAALKHSGDLLLRDFSKVVSVPPLMSDAMKRFQQPQGTCLQVTNFAMDLLF